MKGQYNQECNRSDCKNTEAVYFNHSTKKYYCKYCAELLNEYNRKDAFEAYGHDLCIKVSEDQYLEESIIISNVYNDAFTFDNYVDFIKNITQKDLKRGTYAKVRTEPKISRNEPCQCGSGKKYKKCCLIKN